MDSEGKSLCNLCGDGRRQGFENCDDGTDDGIDCKTGCLTGSVLGQNCGGGTSSKADICEICGDATL